MLQESSRDRGLVPTLTKVIFSHKAQELKNILMNVPQKHSNNKSPELHAGDERSGVNGFDV
jgi:hypothetical protein